MSTGLAFIICTAIVSVCTMVTVIASVAIVHGDKYMKEKKE
jgi:hypothetical protein